MTRERPCPAGASAERGARAGARRFDRISWDEALEGRDMLLCARERVGHPMRPMGIVSLLHATNVARCRTPNRTASSNRGIGDVCPRLLQLDAKRLIEASGRPDASSECDSC
jgi:hypothetical protein